jgi:uncharacterized repeat protein (TIGR03803 family)
MNVLRFRVAACVVFFQCVATAIAAPAQRFESLRSFEGPHGAYPIGSLVQGFDGNLYGTTFYGGLNNQGTVFKVTTSGTLTILYNFCTQANCADGAEPSGGLVAATDGDLYGTTEAGGLYLLGTVFKITTAGTLTTLHSFCAEGGTSCSDGINPIAALMQATNGNFYGTTYSGGVNGYGIVFEITPTGTLSTLHSFDGNDGGNPEGALSQDTNGNFYGTTVGPSSGFGTIFKIDVTGFLTTLHVFSYNGDGAYPYAGLTKGNDGDFYGTADGGGTNTFNGTVFRITPGGAFTLLFSFDGSGDGSAPRGGLVLGTDGYFYGPTYYGGSAYGTIFQVSSGGALTTLHFFDGIDGEAPAGGLVQATDGNFYGTTTAGGSSSRCFFGNPGCGTIFKLSMGLGRFVKTLPDVGRSGTHVVILGNGLTGTTSVTFNGIAATFTVASPTEIKTTVPTGATSGKVQVTTPHGVLTSNVVFRVK